VKTIDLEDLVVRKCDPHIDTLGHMKAGKKSSDALGRFLDWGINVNSWSIQEHTRFLVVNMKEDNPSRTYVAYYKDKFAGLFVFGDGMDPFGCQISYWVSSEFSGKGVATAVTDYLVDFAFQKLYSAYVLLHIDKANISSSRVAEKCGFHVIDQYSCEKNGIEGTGVMRVWIKYHPMLLQEAKEERAKQIKRNQQALRSSWHVSGTQRIADDLFNNALRSNN